ncbi:MAG: hypothetical protein JST42_29715 [Bacteroidetes bacterium]|nr:hypothetical protein [Bacteroidota bacterium]
MNYTRDKRTLLTVYFLFYYGVFLFFFIDHRLLFQYRPIFFNYNRDLSELALIVTGLPKWMIRHPASFKVADLLALISPLAVMVVIVRNAPFRLMAAVFFTVVSGGYFLLSDIFWQVHLEPFILYSLLSFLFWTGSERRFYSLLRACRLYFLYIFFSAAVWKIARGAVFSASEMSRILLLHHSDLLSGTCDSLQCRLFVCLIDHPALSWWIYALGVAVELSFFVGFLTRRWDRLLLGLAFLFVVADLLVMRIPYWTVLMGGVTLWIGSPRLRRSRPGIVVYETTHHENLPALLDLCETSFDIITVFLKPVSFDNLSGRESVVQRWPKTRFIVQEQGESNRAFIRGMFGFVRKQRYTHLHLSTLDNNLLLIALRLGLSPDLHVSLTVHEVNEYFARSFSSFRDWTESLAKVLLHRRIHHHTMFLPAMVERFLARMRGAEAVFIPSRFYASPPPVVDIAPGAPFRIVVPGSVDPNRRDYGEVVAFFGEWMERPSGRSLELVILGDSDSDYGREILRRLSALASEGFRCYSYQGYIPEEEYERQIASADLLWSPLRVNKKSSRNSPETYGQTTASGLTADLLLHHAPALTPVGFELPEAFQPAQLKYDSRQQLHVVIESLTGDPGVILELHQRVHTAFSFFKKENFIGAFRSLTGLRSLSTASNEDGQPR